MLEMLVDLYRTTVGKGGPAITLAAEGPRLAALRLEGRLVQVFRNLIPNAISFSPPDGTVALPAPPTRPEVDVTVADDGPGIAPSTLEAILTTFSPQRPAGDTSSP